MGRPGGGGCWGSTRGESVAQVRLNIADIILALEFEDPAVAGLIGEFYSGFITSAPPWGTVEVAWNGPAELRMASRPSNGWEPNGKVIDDQFSVEWNGLDGRFHFGTRSGRCRVTGLFALSSYLWTLTAVALPKYGGLAIHAASVANDTTAYAFPAPSGTGKSTLVRNSPSHVVLGDECALVRVTDEGMFAYGSPFRSEIYRDFASRKVALRGLHFLEQGPRNKIRPLSASGALQRLLPEVFLSASDRVSRLEAFHVAGDIVAHFPHSILELTEGSDFWGCLDRESDSEERVGAETVG